VGSRGTGYSGARTKDGGFDREQFRDKAANGRRQVRLAEDEARDAKAGIGGVLPGAKGERRSPPNRRIQPGDETCVSPPGSGVSTHGS